MGRRACHTSGLSFIRIYLNGACQGFQAWNCYQFRNQFRESIMICVCYKRSHIRDFCVIHLTQTYEVPICRLKLLISTLIVKMFICNLMQFYFKFNSLLFLNYPSPFGHSFIQASQFQPYYSIALSTKIPIVPQEWRVKRVGFTARPGGFVGKMTYHTNQSPILSSNYYHPLIP